MKRLLLTLSGLLVAISFILCQEARTIDGTNNNTTQPEWGATDTRLSTITSNGYADLISLPAGPDRPNPREISNLIFAQSETIIDALNLSDYVWVFGQFIDHDIVLVDNDVTEPLMIPVPIGDPTFDPQGTGQMVIPMFRSQYDRTTGTSPENPRVHLNSISTFIDGSTVYGSDDHRAQWLRTFQGGKLRSSGGNLLPWNTSTGDFNSARDLSSPFMADATHSGQKLFVTGDVRANENVLLLSLHTIFMREHNRLCDVFADTHPEWDDESLYQHARRYVGGLIQSITYHEWLPAMGVELPDYVGYNDKVSPAIMNVFSAAAFRLGHTLLSSEIVRMGHDGEIIPHGSITLREAFFNPKEILIAGGLDPYFKGMGTQIEQDMDCKLIDDVRNFLFGPPGSGGLDLAAINIMRGRERGLSGFNTIRTDVGLEPYESFEQVCIDPALNLDLETLYGDIDEIDPWVGMLAEEHMSGALFGESIMRIMEMQFSNLRDGDRFYYLNDEALSDNERNEISDTRFSDIIRRNTSISLMQDNVFFAMDHSDIPFANVQVVKRQLDMAVFPNPVVEAANFKAYALNDGNATLQILDASGRSIMTSALDFEEGENVFSVPVANRLLPGLYFAQLTMGKDQNTIKLIVQ